MSQLNLFNKRHKLKCIHLNLGGGRNLRDGYLKPLDIRMAIYHLRVSEKKSPLFVIWMKLSYRLKVLCIMYNFNWLKLPTILICAFFQGYVYESQPGQCCGSCKRISCVLEFPGFSSPIIIKVSTASWEHLQNQCL